MFVFVIGAPVCSAHSAHASCAACARNTRGATTSTRHRHTATTGTPSRTDGTAGKRAAARGIYPTFTNKAQRSKDALYVDIDYLYLGEWPDSLHVQSVRTTGFVTIYMGKRFAVERLRLRQLPLVNEQNGRGALRVKSFAWSLL